MSHNVLITGAAGKLGVKLRAHGDGLGWRQRLLDLRPAGDPRIIASDLAVRDRSWGDLFAGIDTVIHLAGDSSQFAGWPSVQRNNVTATENILDAALRHKVKRVVFASSNFVMAGYRFGHETLTTDMAPYPVNPYGVSKLLGERLGYAAAGQGLSFIALRIGYCQAGLNRPGPHMAMGRWGQQMWLSNRDFCQGIERAVTSETVSHAVLNLMSANPGMRWDIDATRAAIGYEPQDGAAATVTMGVRAKETVARLGQAVSARLGRLYL